MSAETPGIEPRQNTPGKRSRRRWLALTVVTGVVCASALVWYFRTRPPGELPPDVNSAQVEPEIADAIAAARARVLREPRSGTAWGRLGMVLRAHDFGKEAHSCFVMAERLEPDEPRWPYLQALPKLLTDPGTAIPKLERAVQLWGNSAAEPRLRLAEALLAQGRLEDAESHFRQALGQYPGHPRIHLGLGRLAYERDDLPGCVRHLRVAAGSPFSRKAALILLSQAYRRQEDQAALAEIGPVTDLPEDLPWPDPFVREVEQLRVGTLGFLNKVENLGQQGRASDGIAMLNKFLEKHPDSEPAWFLLGQTELTLKNYQAAENAFRKAARLAPDSVEPAFKLGVVLYLQGKPKEATDWFRKAIELRPNYALAHLDLGHCLKQQNDRPGALAAFKEALRYRPDYAPAKQAYEDLLAESKSSGPR